jgi:hypothetical protein
VFLFASPAVAVLASLAFGVENMPADPASVLPWLTPCDGASWPVRFSFIDALGVGHICDCTLSEVTAVLPPPILAFIAWCASGVFWSSRATGVPHIVDRTAASVPVAVGHDPEPFPPVRGTNIGRGVQTPLRIEPERGKRTEDFGCSMSKKLRDVLQQDPSGFHVTDDPLNVWPEPTIIVNPGPVPG